MKRERFFHIFETIDKGIKSALYGALFVSPAVGAAVGFGALGAAGILTGLMAGPVIAGAMLGLFTFSAALHLPHVIKAAKKLTPENIKQALTKDNFRKALKQTGTALKALAKNSYRSALEILPAATGILFAGLAAAAMAGPGLLLALPAVIGIGTLAFLEGSAIGSLAAEVLSHGKLDRLFAPLEGVTTREKAKSFLGRILSYRDETTKENQPLAPRLPLSTAALAAGAITGGLLAATFGWVTLPVIFLGGLLGSALTLPAQADFAAAEQKKRIAQPAAPTPQPVTPIPAPQPQPASASNKSVASATALVNTPTLKESFAQREATKMPAPTATPASTPKPP